MAKLQDYELRRLGQQAVDFFDDMQGIVNYGKYAFPIVSAVPAWKGDNGEMAFYDGATSSTLSGKRIYVRLSSSWAVFATSPFSGTPGDGEGSVQVNSSSAFGANQGFRYSLSDNMVVVQQAVTGAYTALLLVNSTPVVSGNTLGSIAVSFGFNTLTSNVLMEAGKIGGYQNANNSHSFFRFDLDTNQVLERKLTLGGNTPGAFARFGGGGFSAAGVEIEGPLLVGSTAVISYGAPTQGIYSQGSIYYNVQGASNTFTNVALWLRDSPAGSSMVSTMEGDVDKSAPCIIVLGTTSRQDIARIQLNKLERGVGTPQRANLALFMTDNRYAEYVSVDPSSNNSPNSVEDPQFVVGSIGNQADPTLAGETIYISSSLTLKHQRSSIFIAPTLNVQAGSTTVLTNAATVFIDAAPVVAGTNLVVTNSYALWVSGGNVRIDGNLLTGATTPLRGSTFFTTTAIGVSSNNAADTTLIRGVVGTTSLVANTLSDGRTIRLQAWGYYNTPLTPDTLKMSVKLGGTVVLTTGVQTPAGLVSTGGWSLNANIVCQTTGGAGTVFAQGDFPHTTGVTYANWPMVTSSTTLINTTGANVIEITAQWGATTSASQIFLTNAVGELLN